MKRSLLIIALAAVLLVSAVPAGAAPSEALNDQTWIVILDPAAPAAEHAGRLVGPVGGSVQHVYRHVLNGFSFRGSEQAARALERNPNVLRVEPDRVVRMAGETANNGFFRIDADDTFYAGDRGKTSGGTSVRIAVLDTGIMASHIDLAPNLDVSSSISCIASEPSIADGQGHGTHVAGIAAAANQGDGMIGVASEASIVAVKVLDSTGYGTDAEVICGLDHVAGLFAADGVPTVVNLSLGEAHAAESGCASSGIHQAICNLTDDGVTVVAAAGNSAADSTNSFYPAAYPETIAVSAFAALNGTPGNDGCQFFIDTFSYECDDELASFTNYGSVIDVTAPGVRVQSTTFDGGWGLNSGTSMAAPFASGVAALVLAADPSLSPNAVRSIMQTSGECPDGTTAGAATCTGHGQWVIPSLFSPDGLPDPDGIPEPLIDAAAAVAAATSSDPDVTPPLVMLTSPAEGAEYEAGSTVTVSYTCSDAESGIDSCDGTQPDGSSLDTSTPVAGGSFTVTGTNGAGLTTTVTHTYSVVDTTAPVITLLGANPITHEAGDTFTDPGAEVTDNVDPTTAITGTSNVDLNTPGNYTTTYDYTDAAGNPATTVTRDVTVVDTTPPTVTIATPPDGASYLLGATVTADYTCTDSGSGIASCTGNVSSGTAIDTSTEGTHTFSVTGTDGIGNTTTVVHSYSVSAAPDTTPPLVTIATPANGATYEAGSSLTVSFTCDDVESGIATCDGTVADGSPLDTSTPIPNGEVTVIATNGIGLTTTATHTYSVVDTTAPTVAITAPAEGATVGGVITITADASDQVGMAQVEFFVDAEPIGVATSEPYTVEWDTVASTDDSHQLSAIATDTSGITTDSSLVVVTVDNSTPITEYASSEATTYGMVQGTYLDTHASGGAAETITEVKSGGRPSSRTFRLEHTWTIPFGGGDGTVRLDASTTGDESFEFEYSFNGTNWAPMTIVDGSTSEPLEYTLPVGQLAGDLFIRVVDADRSSADVTASTVSIDHLYVESEQTGSPPGLVVEAVVSKVRAVPVVTLTWNDIGASSYIVRRVDWADPVSGITATMFLDETFVKGQSGEYIYQVCNADESICSDWVTVDL